MFQNWELLECAIWLVLAGLRASAGDTRFDKCDDILMHLGPEIVMVEELKCFCLSRVACKWMVMTGFEYACLKVSACWDIDYSFVEEEPSG